MATKNLQYKRIFINKLNIFWGHRQLFKLDGLHPNKLGARVLKGQYIFLPPSSFSGVCQSTRPEWHTHTEYGQNMSDHRTSYQLQSHHVVDTSHKDTDTQPKQALLMETIPAEPCPQSSLHADHDVLQLQNSAPKDYILENSQGSQDNMSYPPNTPEPDPISPDTLSLSPASPLLSFSQKIEELKYAGTKISHSFAASLQI